LRPRSAATIVRLNMSPRSHRPPTATRPRTPLLIDPTRFPPHRSWGYQLNNPHGDPHGLMVHLTDLAQEHDGAGMFWREPDERFGFRFEWRWRLRRRRLRLGFTGWFCEIFLPGVLYVAREEDIGSDTGQAPDLTRDEEQAAMTAVQEFVLLADTRPAEPRG